MCEFSYVVKTYFNSYGGDYPVSPSGHTRAGSGVNGPRIAPHHYLVFNKYSCFSNKNPLKTYIS